MLCKEVEDAIIDGKFKLYTMENVDDALQVLIDYKDINLEKILKVIEKECKKYIDKPKATKVTEKKIKDEKTI
ncbi:hypothetical protein SDC9_212974 [bioreactor metagenome]|uniref:Uncharacterized protein n=1 Tax=bioreactor metagenome TaxID=1076179 RepID=A0A645JNF9_9ZZZZ